MMKTLRMGLRPSLLALRQAEEVCRKFPGVDFRIVRIATAGDRDKATPLSLVEGADFFTREIEQELLEGRVDVAVHSAKDLEDMQPPGLVIAAITASLSPHECLVARSGKGLKGLPGGARVGTSSRKRREALLRYRADLDVADIRGTIEERLQQLDAGKFDAVIMAHAALVRLGYEARITQLIPASIMEPHPLQGSLAVQVRAQDKELIELFSSLNAHIMEVGR